LKHTNDPGLNRHVLNAIARPLPQGDLRFDRPSQTRQGGDQERRVIDALTAAAMAHGVAAANQDEYDDSTVYVVDTRREDERAEATRQSVVVVSGLPEEPDDEDDNDAFVL
jgi:hypothetical protein